MKLAASLLSALALFPLAAPAQVKTITEVDSCLMSVTAAPRMSPDEEASRKVRCFHGTRELIDKCERAVASTMRLSSQSEERFRRQCRLLAK
ncbi:hypothetical protein [Azonexus hydrophilus]|uniref:UrcA family protein n=1 Tax=Azonexus hydrophilus TaxID=418702 RepID=A0ABZ2XCG4_9RHOO